MIDLFDKCKTGGGYFGPQRASGDTYFTRPTLDPLPGREMIFQGKKQTMWSVNNYLGLAENEEIKQAAREALETYSVSAPMGSRMMSGNTPHHQEFEKQLAEYSQKEDSHLFNYGYLGVLGTIASLTSQDDLIIMDKLAHASIVDATLLAQGKFRVYKHNDMDSLELVLKHSNRDRKGGILIVGEGVYGMTGDLANLPGICDLAKKYDARVFIDDAHGLGVMGAQGRGTADHFGVQDKIDLYFGTFAKSFASIGGFTAANRDIIEWIRYNARTQVFAKSLPMVYVKSLQKALELVINGDENRKRMWDNSNRLKAGLRNAGFYVGPGESPICSVFVPVNKDNIIEIATKMVVFLREEKGIFVTIITYPVIPLGLCMYRLIPTASHTFEDVDKTIKAYTEMRDNLKLKLDFTGENERDVEKIFGK
jgi:glycine C-acetyltransferase